MKTKNKAAASLGKIGQKSLKKNLGKGYNQYFKDLAAKSLISRGLKRVNLTK